jgi:hypothetical protein
MYYSIPMLADRIFSSLTKADSAGLIQDSCRNGPICRRRRRKLTGASVGRTVVARIWNLFGYINIKPQNC